MRRSKYFPQFFFDAETREEFDNDIDAIRDMIESRDDIPSDDFSRRNALNIRISARAGRVMRMLLNKYSTKVDSGTINSTGVRVPDVNGFKNLMEQACIDYEYFIEQYLESK